MIHNFGHFFLYILSGASFKLSYEFKGSICYLNAASGGCIPRYIVGLLTISNDEEPCGAPIISVALF